MTPPTVHPIRAGLAEMLANGPVLMSGAVGTELERRGAPTPLPLWSTAAMEAAPDLVRQVHTEYVRAGAQIVTANTFRTDRYSLRRAAREGDARALTRQAVHLAREGVAQARPEQPVLIVGSVAPLEDCYEPSRVPDATTLRIEHGVKVGSLVAAGAPAVWIETMNTIREAVTALEAAQAGALPAAVSFVCGADGALLSGEPLAEAVRAVEPLAPMAISVNCCHVDAATRAVHTLVEATDLPVGVYANGRGSMHATRGWEMRGGTTNRGYLRAARAWLDAGARLVGGCCGTTPRTIGRLRKLLDRS